MAGREGHRMPPKRSSTKGKAPSKYAGESAEARFKRLAGARVSKALDALDRVAATGRSRAMSHTPQQAQVILGLLTDGVKSVAQALEPQTTEGKAKRVIEL